MRCSAVAICAALACAMPARADTLVDNVEGFTLDKEGQIERLNGLVIGDDGRIVQVLRRGDKRPGKVDYKLDGKGQVLMPGIVDSHVNLIPLGFQAYTLDLSAARSLAEAQGRIAAYAAAHPDRTWIIGRGWNEERWNLNRLPTAADLDTVTAGRPAWILREDGETGWANTAALAAAGLSATTKDPAGGRIERAAGSAKPSGIVRDSAMALIQRVVPAPRPEDRDLALSSAQDALLSRGITAVSDMGTTIEDWQTYRRAGDLGTLRLRIMAYAAGTDAMALIGGPGPTPWLYEDRLRLNGVNLSLDGPLAARGAYLSAPYADAPAQSGRRRLDDTRLRNLMSRAAIDRFQVALDAHGDKAASVALDAIAELAATYKGDRRWRIEGLQVLASEQAARFAATGTIASTRPAQIGAGFAIAETRLGAARTATAWPLAGLARARVRVAFGSGAPLDLPDPWAALASATTRQDAAGQPFGGWQPQERITREAALAAMTADGAHAGFADGKIGRLAVGYRADFILVDRDPLMAGPSELRGTRVLETWIGGRRAWAAPATGR